MIKFLIDKLFIYCNISGIDNNTKYWSFLSIKLLRLFYFIMENDHTTLAKWLLLNFYNFETILDSIFDVFSILMDLNITSFIILQMFKLHPSIFRHHLWIFSSWKNNVRNLYLLLICITIFFHQWRIRWNLMLFWDLFSIFHELDFFIFLKSFFNTLVGNWFIIWIVECTSWESVLLVFGRHFL